MPVWWDFNFQNHLTVGSGDVDGEDVFEIFIF